jgi:peptidoglycan/LPS O-acetylase OafA/YrhL
MPLPLKKSDDTSNPTMKPRGSRRLDIQGLRAVAVLMVVAFHAGLPVHGGFVGVDVFFVISGFVITGLLQREWAATERVRFGAFYVRRFKRLTPALALMVGSTAVASALFLSPLGPQQTVAKTAVGAMLLTANRAIAATTGGYFDPPAASNPLLNTWTLSVEEQFYLLWPLAVLGLLLLKDRRIRLAVVAACAIGSGIAMALVYLPGGDATRVYYGTDTHSFGLALGAVLAILHHDWS